MAIDLRIVRVQNASIPNGEFVILQATADTNLNHYAVVDTTFNEDGSVSNEHRHVYFFPARALKKDEWVVLCSGSGTKETDSFKDKTPYYIYYWRSGTCIWNDNGGDTASLIKYYNGNSVSVPPVKK